MNKKRDGRSWKVHCMCRMKLIRVIVYSADLKKIYLSFFFSSFSNHRAHISGLNSYTFIFLSSIFSDQNFLAKMLAWLNGFCILGICSSILHTNTYLWCHFLTPQTYVSYLPSDYEGRTKTRLAQLLWLNSHNKIP